MRDLTLMTLILVTLILAVILAIGGLDGIGLVAAGRAMDFS